MTNATDTHPLAPREECAEEGPGETHNETETVRVRAGVELGAMRYVLIIGMLLAVVAFALAYLVF